MSLSELMIDIPGWVRVTFYRAKKKIEEYMEEQGYE